MNLLNFPDWKLIEVTEAKSHYFIRAEYKSTRARCPSCPSYFSVIEKYGTRLRSFKDAPVRGKTVSGLLSVQRYRCFQCNIIFTDTVPELGENARFTRRLVSYIEQESVRKNFLTVASETGISEGAVREIFERFIEKEEENSLPFETPTILGIDDVYIGGVARCILTDIQRKRVIDILPKRDIPTVYGYLINMKNRGNVEVIAIDMCRPFFDCAIDAFPRAEVVIDTFHVQRMINQAVNIFLKNLRNSLGLSERRIQLRDRFLLMKRSYNLDAEEKKTLLNWRKQLPHLNTVYELKEEFFTLWRFSDRKKAEAAYNRWLEKIPSDSLFAFRDITKTIENWHRQIFNYFDYKVTNAFTESANNLVKNVQRQARGCSFKIVRAKILYRHR